jgi:hypothetical protein
MKKSKLVYQEFSLLMAGLSLSKTKKGKEIKRLSLEICTHNKPVLFCCKMRR